MTLEQINNDGNHLTNTKLQIKDKDKVVGELYVDAVIQ